VTIGKFVNEFPQNFDLNGDPNASYTVFFGLPNQDPKTNPKAPFSDAAFQVPVSAIQTLDSTGSIGFDIFLDGGYSIRIETPSGSLWRESALITGLSGSLLAKGFTVASMIADATLIIGQLVFTSGYTTAGDGGGASYLIAASQAVDGIVDHALDNGNVALFQPVNNTLLLEQAGVTSSESSTAMQAAIDYGETNDVLVKGSLPDYTFNTTLTSGTVLVDWNGAEITYTGATDTFAMVVDTDVVGGAAYRYGMIRFFLKSTSVDIINRTHGVNCGGSNLILRDFKIQGFTGISLALGSGVEAETGVTLPATSSCFYWSIDDFNIAQTHGWGLVIKQSNNANKFSNMSTFAFNGFDTDPPRANNCITELIDSGLANTFTRVSLEASPLSGRVKFSSTANSSEFVGYVYMENNPSWVDAPAPWIIAAEESSTCAIRARAQEFNDSFVDDQGTANSLAIGPAFFINGDQSLPTFTSNNMIKNGDFENDLNHWADFSTGGTTTFVTGFLTGKAIRQDIVAGKPSIFQTVNTASGINIAALVGRTVTMAGWVRTDIPGVKFRIEGLTGNRGAESDSVFHFINASVRIPTGSTQLAVLLTTEATGLTGFVELSNVTMNIGNKAIAMAVQTVLDGSATFDPTSLADGAGETTTVTSAGAALGDFARASFGVDLQGIILTAWVSAVDTVSVRFQNETGGVIDLASSTLSVLIDKN